MKNYIVLDLEATCESRSLLVLENRTFKNEIIEIGAVKINEKGEVIDTYERFVKPYLNPILTTFCKELTKIPQEEIDVAEGFPEVLSSFQEWIGEDYILCSWGFYDKKQFVSDCELHHLDTTWVNSHISLKHQYQKIKRLSRAVGVSKALEMEGFQFEGTKHRGIDDARNISKIFLKLKEQWKHEEEC